MGRHERLLQTILRGQSDANIRFADLCALLRHWVSRNGYEAATISSTRRALWNSSICKASMDK